MKRLLLVTMMSMWVMFAAAATAPAPAPPPAPLPAVAPAPVVPSAPAPASKPDLPSFEKAGAAPVAPAPQPRIALTHVAKPNTAVARDGCVTSECHADIKNFKVLHGPVNVNACDACHKSTSDAAHTFELVRNKTETCTFCHQLDTHNDPVVHKPVAEGQCLSCHNPHGGTNNKFFRGNSMRELCATCHKDNISDKSHVHGPIAAGACDSCHSSHSAKFPKLLAAQGRDLCLSCHAEMKTQMASAKFVHKAVEGNCTDCHDAHASNYTMQIKKPPLELCSSCHEKQKNAAMNATFKHSVVTKDQACLNCHTAHGGDLAKLMRAQPVDVCMKCHDKDQTAAQGRVVKNVAMISDPTMSKHGPIRDGNCSGCHNAHGSDVSRLLAKPYPAAFYQDFAESKYELCFSCHDKQLVETQKTANLTGFRNGAENLHFVHVNREKGRNCRSCHETHAGPGELHVRDSVPFGNWQMPIRFAKNQTGGSCSPGCHKSQTYDRNNPVNYASPTTMPATTPRIVPKPNITASSTEVKQ